MTATDFVKVRLRKMDLKMVKYSDSVKEKLKMMVKYLEIGKDFERD